VTQSLLEVYVADVFGKDESPFMILAGYVSTAARWQSFSDEWRTVLAAHPQLTSLKMEQALELEYPGSPFYGKTVKERDDLVLDLSKVIRAHTECAFTSVVPIEAYRRIIKETFYRAPDLPYFLSFWGLANELISTKGLRHDRTNFIFDAQDAEYRLQLEREYRLFTSIVSRPLQQLLGKHAKFDVQEESPPLQAVDMLAWYTKRVYRNLLARKALGEGLPFFTLFDVKSDISDKWTDERLEEAESNLRGIYPEHPHGIQNSPYWYGISFGGPYRLRKD
jgi:hypothetical protein